ncbi:hypothetical protein MTO96_048812 [Rhipicephalus appendiculatus]
MRPLKFCSKSLKLQRPAAPTLPTVKKLRTQGIFLPERIAAEVVSVFAPDELRDCYGMTEVSGFLAVPPKGGTTARKRRIPRMRYKDESDLGYYDNDGRLFLAGRLKNTMFRMAKHINPAEIEHWLYAHWAISEVAVLPVPREDTDDDPAAIIVLKQGVAGDQKLAEEIKAFVAAGVIPKPRSSLEQALVFVRSEVPKFFTAMRAKIVDGIVYSPYPDLEDLRDVSTYAFLTRRLQKYGDKAALIHGQDKISYSELLERLKIMASGFRSHGIGTGDRVLVHVENGIDSFVAACSIPLTGATLVTSDVTFNEEELLDHAKRTDATHLLTGKAYIDLFNSLSTVLNFKSRFSFTDMPGYINVTKFSGNGSLKQAALPNHQVGVKFVCHSTGTTGISKIIEIPEETFLSQISCREKFQLATPEDVCIGGGNISFYVCFTYVFFVISIGGTIVLLDKYSPIPDVFAAFRDHQVTLVHGTPAKILEIVHEAKRLGQSFPPREEVHHPGNTDNGNDEISHRGSVFTVRAAKLLRHDRSKRVPRSTTQRRNHGG